MVTRRYSRAAVTAIGFLEQASETDETIIHIR